MLLCDQAEQSSWSFQTVSQHQKSSVQTFLSAAGEGMLGTSKHTSTSPALAPSLLRSELLGHEEALGRLFPWSLGGRGTHTALSAKPEHFSSVGVRSRPCSF